jgi:hypothetical protein
MESTSCRSIREAVAGFLGDQIEVSTLNNQCVLTLPLKTLDDRFIEVYIEQKLGSNVLVHDGGKSMAELFAQGIHLTDAQHGHMKAVARRHGVTFSHGIFQVTSEVGAALNEAVLAIAQCASIAMMPVATHEPTIEDEPVAARVARALLRWKPDYVDLEKRKTVRGRRAEHFFDFVSIARIKEARTVAIKILPPSHGPKIQARGYGFLALDIDGGSRIVDQWRRLAIITKVEEWPDDSLKIVRDLSADTIELQTEEEHRVESILPPKMTELTEAA